MNRLSQQVRRTVQARFLNLHEYQAKELMANYGVRVQRGFVADTAQEAREAAQKVRDGNASCDLIVKAQVLAGGRGKGHFPATGFKGGVHVLQTPEEVSDASEQMLGQSLVTKQTDAHGQLVSKVLVHEGVDFDREMYFALLMDRAHDGPVMVGSPMGGVDIEEVAEENPEAILTIPCDIHEGCTPAKAEQMARFLGFDEDAVPDAVRQIQGMYDLFIANDCTQVEINPLVFTRDNEQPTARQVFCVDAKLGFDENAAFRHKELFAMRDTTMEDPREVRASQFDLNYIGLDGNIGCMVNGAGLAMATMDAIKMHNGDPANFLDVGGSATTEQVTEAFTILNDDEKVRAILVNIFGGIMRCDTIAEGIVQAAQAIHLDKPLVVRLEGTNVDIGKQILESSGLKVIMADDLDDACSKAVQYV
ncbi:MAG: hypothetical protein MHM6MM_005965 [Cercozoa sp. M6MM]